MLGKKMAEIFATYSVKMMRVAQHSKDIIKFMPTAARKSVLENLGVYLRLTDGELISLDAALSATIGSYDRNARHRVDKSAEIGQIIDSVPKVPSTGGMEQSVRPSSAIVTAIAVAGLAAAGWFLLSGGKPQ